MSSRQKDSYLNLLKEAVSNVNGLQLLNEWDTTKTIDVKGPMLEPILGYESGDGELVTHQDAASILERYYSMENSESAISLVEHEDNEISEVPDESIDKTKDSIEDEVDGGDDDGTLQLENSVLQKLISEMENEPTADTEVKDKDIDSKEDKEDETKELNIDKELKENAPPSFIPAKKKENEEELQEAYRLFTKNVLNEQDETNKEKEENETKDTDLEDKEIDEWISIIEQEDENKESDETKEEETKKDEEVKTECLAIKEYLSLFEQEEETKKDEDNKDDEDKELAEMLNVLEQEEMDDDDFEDDDEEDED